MIQRLLLFLVCVAAFAETDRATVKGTVTDPTGAAMPGVTVSIEMPATGLRRAVQTNGRGFYLVAGLPFGRAHLSYSKEGFQSVRYESVELANGQTLTRDVELAPAAKSTVVEVRADAIALTRDSAELGGVIRNAQISNMPLNGRNWQGLLALAPGAINTGTGDARGMRFTGHGVDDNNFRFDGVDATGVRNQVPRDDVRLAISLESVAEFRVSAAGYSAETGGTMAAQVEVVSRSGSNEFHGSLFEYLRNDKMDARSPFDPSNIPPFRLNQFGGSVGGPLVKDKTFFFANYEGLAQRLGRTLVAYVPSESYRAQALSTKPELRPLLDAYPRSNAATSSADVALWTGPGSQDNDQHSGTLRLDQRFTDRTTMFLRYSTDDMQVKTPLGDSTGYPNTYNRVDERVTTAVAQFQHVFSPVLFNEARVGVNRVPFHSQYDSPILPALRVSGFSSIPGGRESMVNSTTYTIADNLTFVRGAHTWKAGIQLRPLRFALRTAADGSSLTYANTAALLENRLTTAVLNGYLPTRGVSKTQIFAFAQDEWKLRPNLTLNAGLRYEYFGVLSEDHDRAQTFNIETCGGFCAAGAPFTFSDRNNLAPRVSLAWAPQRAAGKTVLRAGFGMYYGEGQLGNQTSPVENETTRISLSGSQLNGIALADLLNPVLPNSPTTYTTAPLDLERRRKDMYTSQWTASVAQSLSDRYAVEASYIGSKGSQLFTRLYMNAVNPVTGARPLPQFGLIPYRGNGSNSNFQGLMFTARRQASDGFSWNANYLWSHAIDEYSAGGDDVGYPQNVNCRRCDRASSDFDIRQTFNLNTLYELPFGRGRRGFAKALLGGWQVGGIAAIRTGRAITVTISRSATDVPDQNVTSPQRPDVAAGVAVIPSNQNISAWLNAAAFSIPAKGAWGNAGRNIARGPVIWNADAALSKRNHIRERAWIELRAEVFNVFNHPQFANPASNFSSAASFGKITQLINTGATGTGTPRQIEFAVRIGF